MLLSAELVLVLKYCLLRAFHWTTVPCNIVQLHLAVNSENYCDICLTFHLFNLQCFSLCVRCVCVCALCVCVLLLLFTDAVSRVYVFLLSNSGFSLQYMLNCDACCLDTNLLCGFCL